MPALKIHIKFWRETRLSLLQIEDCIPAFTLHRRVRIAVVAGEDRQGDTTEDLLGTEEQKIFLSSILNLFFSLSVLHLSAPSAEDAPELYHHSFPSSLDTP